MRFFRAGLVLAALVAFSGFSQQLQSPPRLLTFAELVTLSRSGPLSPALDQKLAALLDTPFISNRASAAGARPHSPEDPVLGPVLRVAFWNIERGLQFDLIRLALCDPDGFEKAALAETDKDSSDWAKVDEQLRRLRDADVVVLNEADWGMKRTGYRNVAKDLASALGMNFTFGVEFVEVDPLGALGTEEIKLDDAGLAKQLQEELKPDASRYVGLHGSAILSRYPIERVRMVRLPVCHDWFEGEQKEISQVEKGKRLGANKIFLERIEREVRRGGRMAIVADLRVPKVEGSTITVVAAHLENKCKPGCRVVQMNALLAEIQRTSHPVILAGDLNTSGTDGTPLSIRRLILERVKSYEFWTTQALKWATPASLPLMALMPVKYFKNYLDPTSTHLPVVGSNPEAKLFRSVERFRFDDHLAFDFRGTAERNLHARERTLANSNQRAGKGFQPTFSMKRDFGGLVGRYKLDWFFVKPYIPRPDGEGMSFRFAPHFPVTMRDLNNAVPDGLSDHAPMTVDLPFGE